MPKGGLCNQLYMLLHGLLVAVALEWDFELPPLLYQSTGASQWQDKKFGHMALSRLLNVTRMQEAFLMRRVGLHPHGSLGPTHDVPWQPPRFKPLGKWVQAARSKLQKAGKSNLPFKLIYSKAGAGDVAIGHASWPLFRGVVRDLHFADEVRGVADRIVAALTARHAQYNAVHLRIEDDFVHHPGLKNDPFHRAACAQSSFHCLGHAYVPVIVGLKSSLPFYAASGVFSTPTPIKTQVLALLEPLAPAWNYSTQFLSPEEQQALVFEQVAAVDLLVLAGANLFVGMSRSTFSCFVAMYRECWGAGGARFVDPVDLNARERYLPHRASPKDDARFSKQH
eukprot:EG_transcript_13893